MIFDEKERREVKQNVEAKGDSGLLNLMTADTVFYVGGYPETFKVVCVCVCVCVCVRLCICCFGIVNVLFF